LDLGHRLILSSLKVSSQTCSSTLFRDKVERKKAQNRTAAFRYREKKKAEQDAWDEEIRQLEERNTALKARLRHMEQELSCVKRLMVDTGLGHFIAAGP